MNKTLYSLILGASALAGCTTTEYTPRDLSGMLNDGDINYTEFLAFKKAQASLQEKAQKLEGDQKTEADQLVAQYGAVINEFDSKVKYVLIPVAELATASGPGNLGLTNFFEPASYEGTAKDIEAIVGSDVWGKLQPKARQRFESTYGNPTVAELVCERVPRKQWEITRNYIPAIGELLDSRTEDIVSNSTGYRLLIKGKVEVTDELKAKVPFSQVSEETLTEQPKEEPKAQ